MLLSLCALAYALGLVMLGVAMTLIALTALSVYINREGLEGCVGLLFGATTMATAWLCLYLSNTPPCR